MTSSKQTSELNVFQLPVVGSTLTILSGLSFLALCMLLPLVGRSGATAPHGRENFWSFLGVVLLSLVLAALAAVSKMERRKIDGSPLPYFSLGLCGLAAVLLLALVTGLLSI